jgi:integrase
MDDKVGKPNNKIDWRSFLRIGSDGWSSEFSSVDLLLKHLMRKSKSIASRDSYCFNVWILCSREYDEDKKILKVREGLLTPDELASASRDNPALIAKSIQNIADYYYGLGSTRYANQIIHLARTFFKVNNVELDLHGYFQPTRSRKRPEYIPTLAEALKMAEFAGSLRDQLIIKFLVYGGFRNSTLRSIIYNASYADPFLEEYTIKNEVEREKKCLIIIVHEAMKKIVPNACKNRVFYYTFIPPQIAEDLRLYLRELERKYGPLTDDQPIFFSKDRRVPLSKRLKKPISARELQEIVKNAAKRAGIKNWKYVTPHCLRKTHESFLRNQPDEVRLDVKEREFLFGHTLPGSQDTYFDKTKIEEMRAKYAKMIFEPASSVEKEERVIGEDELQRFLQEGWHFEATLPSGKVVVSRKVRVRQSEEAKTTSNVKDSSASLHEKEPLDSRLHTPQPIDSINQPPARSNNPETVNASSLETGQSSTSKPIDPFKPEQEHFSTTTSPKGESPTEEKGSAKVPPKEPAPKLGQKSLTDFFR